MGRMKSKLCRLLRMDLSVKAADKVRLHLGCDKDYWKGWVNIDVDPAADCDLCVDFMRIGEFFAAQSVSEAAMIHSLSYLSLWQARDLFSELFRLMTPSGKLVIELPDLAKCAQAALARENDLDNYIEAVRGIYAFDIAQLKQRRTYIPYASGWSSWHLELELKRVGFQAVIIGEPQTHGARRWRDTRVEAVR